MTDYLDWRTDMGDPELADTYDDLSFWSARFGALLVENLSLGRHIQGLDIGCGTGFPLLEMARRHGASSYFVGVDVWRHGLRRANRKRRGQGVGNADVVLANAERLPFPPNTFDLILSNLGVNNFDDPAAALTECRRVARPGARLVLTTNTLGHMREFYAIFRDVLKEIGAPGDLERLEMDERHRASRDGLVILLEAAGFRATRLVESSFQLRFLDGSALLRDHLVRLGFLDGWRNVVDRERAVRVFGTLEERLNAVAEKAGGLTLTVPMLYLEASRSEDHPPSNRAVELS